MVECGICLEDYQESDLELHREMCVVRLMFRCSLCGEDYVSKEGLWNHLDLHEIVEESKELHYEEIKAKHKLHQCVICNDQRAYSESPYWKHVQDVHGGLFLRCSDCGENFRSEKLKNDHTFSRCKTSGRTEALELIILKEEPDPIEVANVTSGAEHVKGADQHKGELTSANQDQNQILVSRLDSPSSSNDVKIADISAAKKDIADKRKQSHVEDQSIKSSGVLSDTQCVHCGKECPSVRKLRLHIGQIHKPTKCKICGITFEGAAKFRYHRIMTHDKPRYQCAKCQKIFPCPKPYKFHLNVCDPVKSIEFLINKNTNDSNPVAENTSGEVCSQCGIKESCAYTLALHNLIHHDPVACDFCGDNLSSLLEAQHHVKTVHRESKRKCPHCSMRFASAKLLHRHVSRCKDEKTPCEQCGKMLTNEIALIRHQRSGYCEYQKSNEPAFFGSGLSQTKCHYCSEEFLTLGHLNRHLKICHELTKCDICGITVLGLSKTKHHKHKWHKEPKYECPTCGTKFQLKHKYEAHRFVCEGKMYSCNLCGHMFRKWETAKQHTTRHHAEQSNYSNIQIIEPENQDKNNDLKMEITIDETTISAHDDDLGQSNGGLFFKTDASSESSLALAENPSNQPYSCKICGITFTAANKTLYHMKTRHTEPTHQCPNCTRKFHFRRSIVKHVLVCVGFKHTCELCGLKFPVEGKLENHKRRVHQDRLPGVFGDAQFSKHSLGDKSKDVEAEDLNKGIKIKTEATESHDDQFYPCSICGLTFGSESKMRHHMNACHEEPRYQCSFCQKRFYFTCTLRRHEKICLELRCNKT